MTRSARGRTRAADITEVDLSIRLSYADTAVTPAMRVVHAGNFFSDQSFRSCEMSEWQVVGRARALLNATRAAN